MKKKFWFYLCIIQAIILASMIAVFLWSSFSPVHYEKTNLQELLEELEGQNYLPETGYIPDAKTAKIVGACIIDNLTEHSRFRISSVTVEYDEENRLWLVSKGYLFSHGGFVVIEQDSGKIVKALLMK